MLSLPDRLHSVTVSGARIICDAREVRLCYESLCEDSIHTHQQEIQRGFVATSSGCRAGLAGIVVAENGNITAMREITSICLRIARRHDGCAEELAARLFPDGKLAGLLLCGEPAGGKTSLLRDLARLLSEGGIGRRLRIAVVDERGELSGAGALPDCDVLRYCPKAAGIAQAVRTLAPEAIVFDELGGADEITAVTDALHSGVFPITSVHCRNAAELLRRPATAAAVRSGTFTHVVFLEGRTKPGSIRTIYTV